MRRSLRALVVVLTLAAWPAAHAQRPDSSTFADLRVDGNGIAQLRATIGVGFDNQTAGNALAIIADLARLNLTFDPRLPGLESKLTMAPHDRPAAVALLEIARVSRVLVRVSPRGQLVVVAAPNSILSRQPAEADTAAARRAVSLPPVRTEAERAERKTFATNTNVGAVSITGRELRASPSFVEPDVLRSVQLLPGIEVRSDWTAGFNVRGGEGDQSLVMIDGYPIYNPYHLGGVFSTFIDPTVGRIELRKGALPSRFGGRLSGVLDVQSAEPQSDAIHGTAEVSLVSTTASAGRTFADGAGSWMVAARRTYADAVVSLFKPDAFPYHFQDFQGHATRVLANGTRLSATAYTGLDAAAGQDGDEIAGAWGNSVVGTTVARTFGRHPTSARFSLGDSVTGEQRLSWTRFAAHLDAPNEFFHAQNNVSELRLAGSLASHWSQSTTTVGYELLQQRLRYHGASAFPTFGDIIPFDSLSQRADVASLYADQVWRPDSSLVIEAGARFEVIRPLDWSGVSPRVSIKYLLSPTLALTAGGGVYSQWMHSLGREEEPVQPLQFWVGSDSLTPVSRARDVMIGVERWIGASRLLHVEAFYKRYNDLLVPNLENDARRRGDEFTPTTGTSYGVDFLLRQLDGGPFSGWLAYTYALSSRVDPDGAHYFPTQDRRHNLNLVGSWRHGRYTFGARVNAASGLPTTPAVGGYLRDRYNPVTRVWYPTTDFSNDQMIPGAYNSARLPWYTRIDVSANRTMRMFGATVTPYASIVNLLNAHNPAAYMYSFTNRPERASFPNLPFAPTFGVTVAY